MKLSKQLVIIPILMSVVLVGGLVAYSLIKYRATLINLLADNQTKLTTSISQSLDQFIEQHKNALEYVEDLPALKDISEYKDISLEYKGLSEQQATAIRDAFKRALKVYPQLAFLATFTMDDVINVVHEPYSAQLTLTDTDYLNGFSHRDWYEGAMQKKGVYVSESYLGASMHEPVVALSMLIIDNGKAVAPMIAALKLSVLSDKIKEFRYGLTGLTYLVDKNFNLIAHPTLPVVSGNEIRNIRNESIAEHLSSVNQQDGNTVQIYDSMSGKDVFVSFRKLSNADWYVVTQIDVAEYDEPIKAIAQAVLVFAAGLLLVFLVYMYRNVSGLVKRIEVLSEVSKDISKGNFELNASLRTFLNSSDARKNELSTLMSTFLFMADKLKFSFDLLKKNNEEIQVLASNDHLTGIANRRAFSSHLQGYLDSGTEGAVLLVDIDNFKIINDTMGHGFGDKVLIAVAQKLESIADEKLFVARFGGDEFIVCVTQSKDDSDVQHLITKVVNLFYNTTVVQNMPIEVRFSMGAVYFPSHSTNMSELLKYADIALYKAKSTGKNRYVVFQSEHEQEMLRKSSVENALNNALKHDQFKLLYQPKVALPSGKVIGLEALIRLKDNTYYPDEFIAIAEESGQIIDIGRWVIREVFRQLSEWRKQGKPIVPVAINFSPVQLQDKDILEYLKSQLNQFNISTDLVEFEVTENAFSEELYRTHSVLNEIEQHGCELSIDDFGSGYSSLAYLTTLPVNKIKLDRSICIKYLHEDTLATLKSIIDLAHSLGLTVVAEGIETATHIDMLQRINCDSVQGYYFSKPIPAEEISQAFPTHYDISGIRVEDKEC